MDTVLRASYHFFLQQAGHGAGHKAQDALVQAIMADHAGLLPQGALDAQIGQAICRGEVTWTDINTLLADLHGQCCQA